MALSTWIETKTLDGNKIKIFCATPEADIRGGIVLIQEIFGVNSHIQEVCEKFANSGYLTLAPSLFDRVQPNVDLGYSPSDMQIGFGYMEKLGWNGIFQDIECAYKIIKERAKLKAAVIGYCFGGTVAWRAATQLNIFSASIAYYGGAISKYVNEKPNCPVLMHFGLKDTYITAEDRAKIKSSSENLTIYEYEADHGFNCDQRSSFDAACANLAYERTLEFLKKNI